MRKKFLIVSLIIMILMTSLLSVKALAENFSFTVSMSDFCPVRGWTAPWAEQIIMEKAAW